MKNRIITMVIGLLLMLGATVALPAAPADAHNWDDSSTWSCAVHRPANTVLVHSWPYGMNNGVVDYWCEAGFYGVNHQYWVRWDQNNNTITRISGYQSCKPQGYYYCGTAGHGF
jgi:hypothetical protein